nr:biopolymer transporter ExbD [uncultured Selenomonas sp.]
MRRNFHEVREPLVMIIPMIDIMLFLLVFFMLSTMYMVNTSTVQVNLPQAATAQQDTRPHIVSITVTERGEILFDRDDTPTKELTVRVKERLAEDPETVFVVRGDKKTDYQYIVSVFDALKEAGTRHVSIATETGGV